MKLNNYFRLNWVIQLFVGIFLFTVSFVIENNILQTFINLPLFTLLLVAALEIGKAVSIIWHRYLSEIDDKATYPLTMRLISSAFRFGLLILSFLCSLLYLAGQLDRPKLEQVKAQALEQLTQKTNVELKRLDRRGEQRLATLMARQDKEYSDVQNEYKQRIENLETDLAMERENVVGGTFIGQRYRQIKSDLEHEKNRKNRHLKSLSVLHRKQLNQFESDVTKRLESKRQVLLNQHDQAVKQIQQGDYADDDRVNNAHIVAFLLMLEAVFSIQLQPLQFVFAFSLLISLLMELGIVLAFDNITLTMLPALKTQHHAEIAQQTLKAETQSEAQCEEIRHNAAMDNIKMKGQHSHAEAEAHLKSELGLDH